VYRVDLTSSQISAACYPKPDADTLCVFFSGYVDRAQLALPVFRRWQWRGLAPGHALYISDPTLETCDTLGIGWYIGTSQRDAMEDIARLIRAVAQRHGVPERAIRFYGSSGGGFAALRALRWFPQACAIAINPQTRLTAFRGKSLASYLAQFFDGISAEAFAQAHPTRNALTEALAPCPDSAVVYVQNRLDAHHIAHHLSAFYEDRHGVLTPTLLRHQQLILFEDPAGHDTAEPKAMLPSLFQAAARLQALRFG
jgi:dienelactone hydrolase